MISKQYLLFIQKENYYQLNDLELSILSFLLLYEKFQLVPADNTPGLENDEFFDLYDKYWRYDCDWRLETKDDCRLVRRKL